MRVLITGAAGQLGSDLRRLLPDADAPDRHRLSVTDRAAVAAAVRGHDLVLNCAAYNAVDGAESDPEAAFAVNAEAPGHLAAACREAGARLVHFSTNFVFAGEGDRPFVEADQARPLSVYGRSKLEGERRVLEALPEALVVRSAGLFGATGSAVKGGSFPERIVARARAGQRLTVVDDQRLNPTYTEDLARAALDLAQEGLEGVVHLVAAGCCSFWELAAEAVRLAGLDVEVGRVTTAELGALAARPRNGCLASTRAPLLRHWREGLEAWWTAWSGQAPVTKPRT